MLLSPHLHCPWRPAPRLSRLFAGPVLVLMLAATAACGGGSGTRALDRLHPCSSADGPTDAYCGTLTVFEDRVAKSGRQINLWIVVLPAVRPVAHDPLVFLAGGPGQGAAQLARQVRGAFRTVLRTRDIVTCGSAWHREVESAELPIRCELAARDDGAQRVGSGPLEAVSRRL